ncbi:MAG TPA: hypothetical protein PLM75_01365 [bacterium]|nr:hypothetical protein [bacterium]
MPRDRYELLLETFGDREKSDKMACIFEKANRYDIHRIKKNDS